MTSPCRVSPAARISACHWDSVLPVFSRSFSIMSLRISSGDFVMLPPPAFQKGDRTLEFRGPVPFLKPVVERYILRLRGQFSDRHFLGVSGSSSLNRRYSTRTPNDGRPRSTTALSVLQIRAPPWFISFAVLVPVGTFSLVS